MNTSGYIYLWKQFKDTSFFCDSYAVHIAIFLLMEANYQSRKIVFNGENIVIERGQVLTGRNTISSKTGIKPSTVRNKLVLLKNVGFLDIKANNRFSIISICKYNDYQNIKNHNGQQEGQQKDNQRTTKGQQKDTPNEYNELNKITKQGDDFLIPEYINPEIWKAYLDMRVSIKKPLKTKHQIKLAISTLEKLKAQGHNPDDVLNQSVLNSWAGLFPLKNQTTGGQKNANTVTAPPNKYVNVAWRPPAAKSDNDTGGKTDNPKSDGYTNKIS